MPLHNSADGYGALTKACHWAIVALFAFQYAAGHAMIRLGDATGSLAAARDGLYDWHKSIGLLALLIALVRIWARGKGELPPWAPCLSERERAFVHRAEQVLYAGMVVMPLSGLLYVMAGGYGVRLFGLWPLPNPIGEIGLVASVARWTHVIGGWLLLAGIAGHVGLVVRHTILRRNALLRRMLPGRMA